MSQSRKRRVEDDSTDDEKPHQDYLDDLIITKRSRVDADVDDTKEEKRRFVGEIIDLTNDDDDDNDFSTDIEDPNYNYLKDPRIYGGSALLSAIARAGVASKSTRNFPIAALWARDIGQYLTPTLDQKCQIATNNGEKCISTSNYRLVNDGKEYKRTNQGATKRMSQGGSIDDGKGVVINCDSYCINNVCPTWIEPLFQTLEQIMDNGWIYFEPSSGKFKGEQFDIHCRGLSVIIEDEPNDWITYDGDVWESDHDVQGSPDNLTTEDIHTKYPNYKAAAKKLCDTVKAIGLKKNDIMIRLYIDEERFQEDYPELIDEFELGSVYYFDNDKKLTELLSHMGYWVMSFDGASFEIQLK